MDRNAEYDALMASLSETPLKLDYAVDRARPRYQQWKKRRCVKRAFGIPLGTVAAVCAAFIVLVNASPAFAQAAERVPWLADIADYVQIFPSLDRAADAGYVQPIGQTKTKDGITIRLEGAFSDERQINLYYTVTTDDGRRVAAVPLLYAPNCDAARASNCEIGSENGSLMHCVWDCQNGEKPPQNFKLVMQIYEDIKNSDPKKDAHTDLRFKLQLTDAAETQWTQLGAGTAFTVDGQHFSLADVSVSPTQAQLSIRAEQSNTALMESVFFYLEDENGKRYGELSFGCAERAQCSGMDSGDCTLICTDSPYFSGCKHLTLCITTVSWLDKSRYDEKLLGAKPVHIDLANKTTDYLPEGVAFDYAERIGSGWKLGFSAPEYAGGISYSIFQDYPRDKNGKAIFSSLTTRFESVNLQNQRFQQFFMLSDYSDDEVWLCPAFTSTTIPDEPIRVTIK